MYYDINDTLSIINTLITIYIAKKFSLNLLISFLLIQKISKIVFNIFKVINLTYIKKIVQFFLSSIKCTLIMLIIINFLNKINFINQYYFWKKSILISEFINFLKIIKKLVN